VTYDTGHNFLSNEDEEIEGVIDFEDDEDEFEMLDDEEYEDEDEDEVPAFEDDPMYQSSFELGSWLIQLLSGKKKAISSQKSLADELETTIAVMGAKLAAGLDAMDEVEELGMSIAYLKRSFKSANYALELGLRALKSGLMDTSEHGQFVEKLFTVRNEIVNRIGVYRGEWRRRYGV